MSLCKSLPRANFVMLKVVMQYIKQLTDKVHINVKYTVVPINLFSVFDPSSSPSGAIGQEQWDLSPDYGLRT